jgi:hypothetical protein
MLKWCMCSGHVLTFVIFSKHDLALRNVATCQRFDSETKSGARVICPHIAAQLLMKSIPGQMDFGIHAAVVLVLAVVFNLELARNLSRSRTSCMTPRSCWRVEPKL